MDSVNVGRQLAAMAAEMFNGKTIVVLLPVHGYRDDPSLVPIDNMPGAWPTNGDIAAQAKVLGVIVNHVDLFFVAQGVRIQETNQGESESVL